MISLVVEYNKQYIGSQLHMISIVLQCIDYDKLVLKCIGIALLMINIVVQCIGQNIGH